MESIFCLIASYWDENNVLYNTVVPPAGVRLEQWLDSFRQWAIGGIITAGTAALLFAKLIPVGEIRVTREGDRADYWLERVQCALEVSETENLRELRKRHRQKITQVLGNPHRKTLKRKSIRC